MAAFRSAVRRVPELLTPSGGEAALTLNEAAPRSLGLLDQLGLWGNLGVSLLGLGGAIAIVAPAGAPTLPLPAAVLAAVVGTALGALVLGASLVVGSRTGAPSMVLMRGVVGGRASVVPTVLNVAQCVGWGTFELVIIAQALHALTGDAVPRAACVVAAGVVTTVLTLRPLGAIRLLRRYVSVLVVIAVVVLGVGLLRSPLPDTTGSWTGFWAATDAALAVAISWVPLGSDYSRHSRTARDAFLGGALGLGVTQVACYLLGILALGAAGQNPDGVFPVLLALPLGVAAFAVLVLREGDQSFANVYSTAVSLQNPRPGWDRRVLTVLIGSATTLAALTLDVTALVNFLYLIGAVFVPLSAVLLVAWWGRSPGSWDLGRSAPSRPGMQLAWLLGFIGYQLVNPGAIPGWSDAWSALATSLGVAGHPWLSASVTSFLVAAGVAVVATRVGRRVRVA
jgi:NCS1 family nucleobase:cation symporter-1